MRRMAMLLGLTFALLVPMGLTAATELDVTTHQFCVGKAGQVRALDRLGDTCRRNETLLSLQTGDFDAVSAALEEHVLLIAGLRDDLSVIEADLGDLTAGVATLQGRADGHDSALATLDLRMAGTDEVIGSLGLALDEQGSALVTLEGFMDALEGQLGEVTASVGDLEGMLASLQHALGDLDTATNESFAALEARIDSVTAALGGIDEVASAGDLAALDARVSALEAQMTDVLARLEALEADSGGGDGSTSDADGDGFLAISAGGNDCDDVDSSVYPGAPEVLGDGIDQDCDGVDPSPPACDDGNAATIDTWDPDSQTCTFTPDPSLLVAYYTGPPGTAGVGICQAGLWDGVSTIFAPDVTPAPEVGGDGLDNDCDGVTDEVVAGDLDGDGYLALVAGGNDCDDTRAGVHPGADDFMDYYDPLNSQIRLSAGDGIDNDCDGLVDEETP